MTPPPDMGPDMGPNRDARPAAAMLFAAGFGTRMGRLTAERPKPLIPVAGRALIDHALGAVDDAGIGRIVVNLHYRPEAIRHHLSARHDIAFSAETETILETGGGLRHALALLGEGPVVTLNTDAVWTGAAPVKELCAAWQPQAMDGLLLLIPRDHALGHVGPGDFDFDPEGRIRRGRGYVYSGAGIVKTGGLARIDAEVFSLNRLWDEMAAAGRLFGTVHRGGWCDVGRPASLPLAETLLCGAGNG